MGSLLVSSAHVAQPAAQSKEGEGGEEAGYPHTVLFKAFSLSETRYLPVQCSCEHHGQNRDLGEDGLAPTTNCEPSNSLFSDVKLDKTLGRFPFLKLPMSISCVTVPIMSHCEMCHSSFSCYLHLVLVLPKETFPFLLSAGFFVLFASLF